MKRTTLVLATLIAGAGLALGAVAQTSTDKPAAPKDAAQSCKHGEGKTDCPMHEGKHQGGKHHAGMDGKGHHGNGHHGKGHHGKGHHGKGEGCAHDAGKSHAAGKHDCMAQQEARKEQKDLQKDQQKDQQKDARK